MPRKHNPHSVPYKKPDYHSQNKEEQKDLQVEHKKIKLRSSLDVYNRLMHDKTLNINLNNVNVGYSDHVLGDQEMCILDWQMIDKGGDIPTHHILYFNFILNNGNKLILWDRKTKLDRLYGSGATNHKQRLQIILNSTKIKNIQSQNQSKRRGTKQSKTKIHFSDEKQNSIKMPKQIRHKNEMIDKYFPRYPVTADGFVESFEINDTHKWLKYLNHYGLVVLKVLKPHEANQAIGAMFDEVHKRTLELKRLNNEQSKTYKVDINNPFTWSKDNWPKPRSKFLTDRPAFCKQAFVNRCCDKMYFIFKTIYNDSKLNVTIDNWGIQRGTKHLVFKDPKTGRKLINGSYDEEQKQWRKNLTPHWDINPWQYLHWLSCGHYKHIYQGALALSEQRLEDGTHLTLPGSANFLSKWCQQNKHENKNPNRHTLNAHSHLIQYMQPIPLRQGEFVIWNYGQCHANTKNFSDRMRLSQYIRMFPAQKKYISRDHYSAQAILAKYKREIDINEILGDDMSERTQKLLGLKQWKQNEY